jgi:hypothetical protein
MHELDPSLIPMPHDDCRIYGDDRGELCAFVDAIDYQWAVQWIWSPKWSRGGRKFYLRRNVQEQLGPDYECPVTGRRLRNRVQRTLFLHVAIMKRTGIEPPSPEHTMVDHRDSDSLNCRRGNLRWATPSMNAKNINGKWAGGFE